jgi:hypothetical protein
MYWFISNTSLKSKTLCVLRKGTLRKTLLAIARNLLQCCAISFILKKGWGSHWYSPLLSQVHSFRRKVVGSSNQAAVASFGNDLPTKISTYHQVCAMIEVAIFSTGSPLSMEFPMTFTNHFSQWKKAIFLMRSWTVCSDWRCLRKLRRTVFENRDVFIFTYGVS